MSTDQPHFVGNSDLYGVGVRVGLYSQWVATLLVTLFDPQSEDTIRVANIIIQLAIFIGLCVQSHSTQSNVVESVICQFLLCGSLSSLTGDGINRSGHVSGIMRVVFYIMLSAYGCWFYYGGAKWLDNNDAFPNVVFFNETPLDGWFLTVGKVLSTAGLVISVALIFFGVRNAYKRLQVSSARDYELERPTQRPQVEIALLVLSMGLIAFSITIVEYLVDVNRIQNLNDINSVGQLIPLLVGTVSAFLTLWNIVVHKFIYELFNKRRFFKRRCWFLFGKHL